MDCVGTILDSYRNNPDVDATELAVVSVVLDTLVARGVEATREQVATLVDAIQQKVRDAAFGLAEYAVSNREQIWGNGR